MKSLLYFSIILIGISTLTSCFAPKTLIDDDVYMVKNSALPVGESLTDETSYSSYRFRRDNNAYGANVYHGDFASYSFYSMDNCFYNSFLGFRNRNFMFGTRMNPFGTPYFSYDYGYAYAFLGNTYLGYYGALGYLNYTAGNNYDNGFYVSTGYMGTSEFKNAFNGPRSSLSGFSNQYGRTNNSSAFKKTTTYSGNYSSPVVMTGHTSRVNYPIGSRIDYSERSLSANGTKLSPNYKSVDRQNSGKQYTQQKTQVRSAQTSQNSNNGRNQSNSQSRAIENTAPRGSGNNAQPVRVGNTHVTTGRRN
jgi:hypothetical protein